MNAVFLVMLSIPTGDDLDRYLRIVQSASVVLGTSAELKQISRNPFVRESRGRAESMLVTHTTSIAVKGASSGELASRFESALRALVVASGISGVEVRVFCADGVVNENAVVRDGAGDLA